MCDYSLSNVQSRAARVGDKLVTKNFNSGTKGFAPVDDPTVAVCVLPGTELAFDGKIAKYVGYGLEGSQFAYDTAIFRQVNKEQQFAHHDAIELPDGQMILLTWLKEDQTATVLQLPATPKTAEEAKEQERAAFAG